MKWKEHDDLLQEGKERSKECTESGLVKGHRGYYMWSKVY